MNPDSPMAFMTFGSETLAFIISIGALAFGIECMKAAHEWCQRRNIESNGVGFVGAMASVAFILVIFVISCIVHLIQWSAS